ncbi:MAG TPA: hypothetical protein PK185_11065 [Cyclobacteriaceae bacterium]|nr:hypothetical protein [Cyclobacteriaceae bacterium]
MKLRFYSFLLLSLMFLDSCSSGKAAYKQGDYYEAVLAAVQRLRGKPDHKKSREVLKLSYQLAVDYLETDAKNQIAANANFKYKTAVENYEKINHLYEEIRTSPGALRVIPKPVAKYDELTEVKAKAAEETYEAGIQALLKNTREDAKQAYYYFNDANTFSPGYREAIEMIEQAKFNATLKVVVQPSLINYRDWNFEPIVFGYNANMFVKFYTPQQAEELKLEKVDQYIKVIVNGYQEGRPIITSKTESFSDSVKTGEKIVKGVKTPIHTKVSATLTTYTKKITGRGSINLIITDAGNRAEIKNQDIIADETWSDSWGTYKGDERALSDGAKRLCQKKEPYPERTYIENRTRKELDNRLSNELRSFYSRY